jgi:hypothetical protein
MGFLWQTYYRCGELIRDEEVSMEKIRGYAFSTVLDASYEDAVSRVTDALKEEGFGVLTEIDVKATLKKKLGVDFRKYVILRGLQSALCPSDPSS